MLEFHLRVALCGGCCKGYDVRVKAVVCSEGGQGVGRMECGRIVRQCRSPWSPYGYSKLCLAVVVLPEVVCKWCDLQ